MRRSWRTAPRRRAARARSPFTPVPGSLALHDPRTRQAALVLALLLVARALPCERPPARPAAPAPARGAARLLWGLPLDLNRENAGRFRGTAGNRPRARARDRVGTPLLRGPGSRSGARHRTGHAGSHRGKGGGRRGPGRLPCARGLMDPQETGYGAGSSGPPRARIQGDPDASFFRSPQVGRCDALHGVLDGARLRELAQSRCLRRGRRRCSVAAAAGRSAMRRPNRTAKRRRSTVALAPFSAQAPAT